MKRSVAIEAQLRGARIEACRPALWLILFLSTIHTLKFQPLVLPNVTLFGDQFIAGLIH